MLFKDMLKSAFAVFSALSSALSSELLSLSDVSSDFSDVSALSDCSELLSDFSALSDFSPESALSSE